LTSLPGVVGERPCHLVAVLEEPEVGHGEGAEDDTSEDDD
jgi:hypothetical protein